MRVNDYNPLILSLWKANTDIQYIAESSLALAHYVTGYITKAEKSSMQDLWQEVGSNKSIYSRLWSFGVRSLRSRECGMWQTELRQLSAGIYNLMRSGKHKHGLTVNQFLNGISSSCENVEANLSTIFMSVRGTKQYWFLRNSELKCMIREWGTPTLFLTFSCAEYESPDIINYLKKVNNVPDNYPHGKLCTEDPISVS